MKIRDILTKNSRLSICFCLFVVIVSAYAARQSCGTVSTLRMACLEVQMYCPEPTCVLGSTRCRAVDTTIRITCERKGWTCVTDSIRSCENY